MTCSVHGCDKPVDKKGHCNVHYMRKWRYGTTDLTSYRKQKIEHSHGYIRVYCENHEIADSSGYVYEHRLVYFNAYGSGPFNCFHCGKVVTWECMHVDHLDDNKKNNDLKNLVASCAFCNQHRRRDKAISTWRKKTGLEYNNKIYSVQELADMAGVSRPAMISRLKKMSVEDAVTKKKSKTGPKS